MPVRSSVSTGSRRSAGTPHTASTIRLSPKRIWQKSSATRGNRRSRTRPWTRQNGTLARLSRGVGDHRHPGCPAQVAPLGARLTGPRRGPEAARRDGHEDLAQVAKSGDRSGETGRGSATLTPAANGPGCRSIHVPLQGEEVGELGAWVDVYFHDRVHPLAPPPVGLIVRQVLLGLLEIVGLEVAEEGEAVAEDRVVADASGAQ